MSSNSDFRPGIFGKFINLSSSDEYSTSSISSLAPESVEVCAATANHPSALSWVGVAIFMGIVSYHAAPILCVKLAPLFPKVIVLSEILVEDFRVHHIFRLFWKNERVVSIVCKSLDETEYVPLRAYIRANPHLRDAAITALSDSHYSVVTTRIFWPFSILADYWPWGFF